MNSTALNPILDNIYASLKNDNEGLDAHITALKNAMQTQGASSVEVNTTKLAQPNRQGRKMMQAYFKKRGVVVTFGNEVV